MDPDGTPWPAFANQGLLLGLVSVFELEVPDPVLEPLTEFELVPPWLVLL
jgi:hypothetical protein